MKILKNKMRHKVRLQAQLNLLYTTIFQKIQ